MRSGAGQVFDVIVVGAGPAGAAAALALAAKGFSIAVIGRAGAGRSGVQGLSARALVSLNETGLGAAAACASELVPRRVSWAGERSQRGQEALIDRDGFDARLRVSGCWMEASVQGLAFVDGAWEVETDRGGGGHGGRVRGRALLDARGRFARRCDERGPLLVSWSIVLESGRSELPRSALAALEDGWCWFGVTGSGILCAQFVGSAHQRLSHVEVGERVRRAVRDLGLFEPQIDLLLREGTYHACAAVARYSRPSRGPGCLRIGDAAVAMDPLSGNGIHEAIRSAHVAAAAINSFLLGESWDVVARFVDERARELWRRSVSAAAGFYGLQAEWCGSEFWRLASASYARAAMEALPQVEGDGRFEMRPVLNSDRIELHRVWVSPDWPRGVWKFKGRSLEEVPVAQISSQLRRAASAAPHEV